jgi:hypothetical protein
MIPSGYILYRTFLLSTKFRYEYLPKNLFLIHELCILFTRLIVSEV